MFKPTRRVLAATAFCFGLAFSLSAVATACEDCYRNCLVERSACRAAGTPSEQCLAAYAECRRLCNCRLP
ncbi:hypothetical protein J5226_13780 [Lysobacter sp. K5869]|uniref:hypothetical protein n=1 Tax=Lysobacter sp. K5869 TaxID=2820808 RepID=UPI001C062240|nr:hypothetical protein [Lysobacter sp. K5869]QWP74737.1 hypothetical protein J5226_13780 [Lysobacter sp. K5869]